MKGKHRVIPVFIPHKGCPFDCIYCNQKMISGQVDEMTVQKMEEIIQRHLSTIPQGAEVEIAFFGGSFTGIEKEQQIQFLKAANSYIKQSRVVSIRLSTRPDYITEEILNYLKLYHVRTIELGVQSLDEEVLQKSCRGHNKETVIKASALIKRYGFNLGIQTMVGLPGDNRRKDLETAHEVVKIAPKIVRIYPALVIRNTYLERMYQKGSYHPVELEEAVGICSELLEIYEKHNIKVIRIGLQPTENINQDGDVVAGPFHPAFRQLVESRLMLGKIEKMIIDKGLQFVKHIDIYVDPKEFSNAVGQKKYNIYYLKDKYGYQSVKIKPLLDKSTCIAVIAREEMKKKF